MDEVGMRGTRLLLAAVIAMGVMILAATAVLIATVVHRVTDRAHPAAALLSTHPADRPPLSLGQPAGTRLVSVVRQSDRLLALTLSGGGLPDRLLVWDTLSGRIIARLRLDR